MDKKTDSCLMMACLLAILALFVGCFQFYVNVKSRVNGIEFHYVEE